MKTELSNRDKLFTKHSIDQTPPSTDLGPVPTLEWIDKTLIDIDPRYQREISRQGRVHINNILRSFQWKFFQVLTVTPKGDKRYNAIDGQHRELAALRHPLVTVVPCLVLPAMSMAEQAAVFSTMNGKRLAVSNLSHHYTALAAGDKTAMRIDYICSEAGLTVLRSAPQGALPPKSTIALGAIKKMMNRMSDAYMIRGLSLMVEAWGDKENAFKAQNIFAVLFVVEQVLDLNDEALRRVLRGWEPTRELLMAYQMRNEKGGIVERHLSNMILERYSKMLEVMGQLKP